MYILYKIDVNELLPSFPTTTFVLTNKPKDIVYRVGLFWLYLNCLW